MAISKKNRKKYLTFVPADESKEIIKKIWQTTEQNKISNQVNY